MSDVTNLTAERYGFPTWWRKTAVPMAICAGCGWAVPEDESCQICAVRHAAAKRRTRVERAALNEGAAA